MLQQRADQVRAEIIKGTQEGCAFSYEEGEYRNGAVPYGRVARTTKEFDSDGQPAGTRSSVSGLQNTLSGGGSDASDLPAWLSEQVVSLVDMQARGTYAGESSLIGQPSLRYEARTEGGASSSDPTETLFIFDFVIDNPFIRSEQQYTVFPDGDVRLERQWAMSEFGVEGCGPDGEAAHSTGEAAALEIKQNAQSAHDALVESIEAGCALMVTGESVFTPQTNGEAQRLEGDYARNLLAHNLTIAGVVSPETWSHEGYVDPRIQVSTRTPARRSCSATQPCGSRVCRYEPVRPASPPTSTSWSLCEKTPSSPMQPSTKRFSPTALPA